MSRSYEEETIELILSMMDKERKKGTIKNNTIEHMQEAWNITTGTTDYLMYEQYHPTRKNMSLAERKKFIKSLIEVSRRSPRAYVISFAYDLPDEAELEKILQRNKKKSRRSR